MSTGDQPRESGTQLSASKLADLLAPALGVERARELVTEHVQRLHYDVASLSREQALEVLELLAMNEGIVAVVARFAKARLLLKNTG